MKHPNRKWMESFQLPTGCDMAFFFLGNRIVLTFCSAKFSKNPKEECCSNGWAWRFPPKVFEPLNFLAAFEWVHGSREFRRSGPGLGFFVGC